jgi:hypothetical protein
MNTNVARSTCGELPQFRFTADMKRVIAEQRLAFVATVCSDGTANLSPRLLKVREVGVRNFAFFISVILSGVALDVFVYAIIA